MVVVGSQEVGDVPWVLVVMKYATGIMHHSRLITEPGYTHSNIHIIFSCTNYYNIIGLCKP